MRKKKLERRFTDDNLQSFDSTLYVYPSSLTQSHILTELVRVTNALKKNKSFEDESLLQPAAEIIRNELETIRDKIEVRHYVDIFLNKLSGSSEPSGSIRVNRLKISFYQDRLYAVCNGRIKTVKSILYSTVVKTLSNNTELLRFANLLGHGVSYTVLEEIATEAAISLIGQQKSYTCTPEGFFRDVFTMLVYDNIDRREETISGGNTSQSKW